MGKVGEILSRPYKIEGKGRKDWKDSSAWLFPAKLKKLKGLVERKREEFGEEEGMRQGKEYKGIK